MAGHSTTRLDDRTAAWAERARGLSRATLEHLPVGSGTAFFPDAGEKLTAIFFRYPEGWKARAIPDKHFVAGKGFKLSFWNLEEVLSSAPKRVFIVEGELDACALVEAGIPASEVLSVPNGAKERPAEDPKEQRGYDYVRDALAAGLNRAKAIVWCGDADAPGLTLRADMARIFGAARFHFVDWPEGCKDANDVLLKDGPEFLRGLVTEGALPWPVDGLYRLDELPEQAPLTLWKTGFQDWDDRLMLAPRTMSVVTGHPGHGKTVLWCQIWRQVVNAYDLIACVASFETRAKPHLRRQLRTLHARCLERDMSQGEMVAADKWINDHYLFLVHKEQRPTIEWMLDMAEVAVIRHGARIVQVDPWNRLESARAPGENETEYIGRCLRTIHSFAHDLNCHVQILAHPSKMEGNRRGSPPLLEDISGSKNWENMVDHGFTVHRPSVFDGKARKTEANLYIRKARYDELGYPCKLGLSYNIQTGRYLEDIPQGELLEDD